MMKKKMAVLAFLVCVAFLLAACGASASIVGKWKSDSDSATVVEFTNDGTVNTYYNNQVIYSAKYRTDGSKLIITQSGQEDQTGSFKLEGNKLTVTGPDNQAQGFTRQ